MLPHRGRNRVGQVRRQIIERRANRLPKPARSQPSRRFINRNDAPDLQRFRRFLFRPILARIRGIAQNFKLRLNNLQLPAALIFFNLAVERNHLPRHKFVLQISRVEPQAAQLRPSLPHGKLKNWRAARAKQPRIPHFPHHRRHLARPQLGNPPRVQPVFIPKRQIMQQVADRVNPLRGQNLPYTRTNALHILHGGGEFKHDFGAVFSHRMVAGSILSRRNPQEISGV